MYISTHKNFTFQLQNDRRTVETSLFFNYNFCIEIRFKKFIVKFPPGIQSYLISMQGWPTILFQILQKFTRHVMHRARALRNKKKMVGKMAIATALRGFNNLGHSVTPTFLSRDRFYLQRSTRYPKMNKNWAWEVEKFSRFLSTRHRILPYCDCKVRETMVAKFELVL